MVHGTPTSVIDDSLEIDVERKGKARLPLRRIEAVSLVQVERAGLDPVCVLDLVLNWSTAAEGPLKLIRLRSDWFDPALLSPAA